MCYICLYIKDENLKLKIKIYTMVTKLWLCINISNKTSPSDYAQLVSLFRFPSREGHSLSQKSIPLAHRLSIPLRKII